MNDSQIIIGVLILGLLLINFIYAIVRSQYTNTSVVQSKQNQLTFLTTGLSSVEELENIANSVAPFTEKERNDIYELLIDSDTEKIIIAAENQPSMHDVLCERMESLEDIRKAGYEYELKKANQWMGRNHINLPNKLL